MRLLCAVTFLLLSHAASAVAADEASTTLQQLRVTADQSQLLALGARARTIAIANPGVVDVHLVSPTELLLNGKAVGATSLTVFYGHRAETFEVVVQPRSLTTVRPLPALTPHVVQVQRGGRVSHQSFVRDGSEWQELGSTDTGSQPK